MHPRALALAGWFLFAAAADDKQTTRKP